MRHASARPAYNGRKCTGHAVTNQHAMELVEGGYGRSFLKQQQIVTIR